MIFSYYGTRLSEEEIASISRTNKRHGTSYSRMIATAEHHGFECETRSKSNLKEVKKHIEKKIPVIVRFREPEEEKQHYAIIVGIGVKYVVLNDPWHGKNFRMKRPEFMRRWHGNQTEKSKLRWMLVITPKKKETKGKKIL
jgi:predicted double-glycine peptidase